VDIDPTTRWIDPLISSRAPDGEPAAPVRQRPVRRTAPVRPG
jgi:hypothetical protein